MPRIYPAGGNFPPSSVLVNNMALKFLLDESGLVPEQTRARLQSKLERVLTRMSTKGENGGNPFLFVFAATKKHYLIVNKKDKHGRPPAGALTTAATDGKRFFWEIGFLEECDENEVHITMEHEVNHVISGHCGGQFKEGRDPDLLALVVDFYADGMVEAYHQQTRRDQKWKMYEGPNFGKPIRMKEYFEWLDGDRELDPSQKYMGDPAALEFSVQELYAKFLPHWNNSPRRCPACRSFTWDPKKNQSKIATPWQEPCCAKCGCQVRFSENGEPAGFPILGGGGPMPRDQHKELDIDPQRLREDIMQAAGQVKAMYGRGHLPGSIETLLEDMENPTISSYDLLAGAFLTKKVQKGEQKDYSRIRRRPEYLYSKNEETGAYEPKLRLFRPSKKDFTPKYLVMCDTSGSMGDDDCARGVQEIKTVAAMHKSEGYIVPNDVRPIWSGMVRIESIQDLQRFKPQGRGGTDFNLFFDEYKERIGDDHDLLFIITDGDVDHIPAEKCPRHTTVIWLITSVGREFEPNFGRVIYLNGENRRFAA